MTKRTTVTATDADGNLHERHVKPSAAMVLEIMRAHPVDGACMHTFAIHDTARYSARILELRRVGFVIESEPCATHMHLNRVPAYHMRGFKP